MITEVKNQVENVLSSLFRNIVVITNENVLTEFVEKEFLSGVEVIAVIKKIWYVQKYLYSLELIINDSSISGVVIRWIVDDVKGSSLDYVSSFSGKYIKARFDVKK